MYLWLLALHILAFVSWMAGMLYLPRLFIYHLDQPVGSQASATFQLMERRLLRFIMTPAMIATWIFGLGLIHTVGFSQGWLHAKLLLVFFMSGVHGFFVAETKRLAADQRLRSAGFYRVINEVPTVLMIGIVFLVVFKPF